MTMYTSSHADHIQTAKSSNFRRQLKLLHFVSSSTRLFKLRRKPQMIVKKETFFNTTNFHRFHVHLFKLSSPELQHQTDSDSLINTMLIYLLSQFQSLDTFHEHKITDAENFIKEVTNVFTQTEFDKYTEIEVSIKDNFLALHG